MAFNQRAVIGLLSQKSKKRPGRAARKVRKKKTVQPRSETRTPAGGPTNTRPTDERADRIAYWVALNLLLQMAIKKATKAAVPMPPQIFSRPTEKIINGKLFPAIDRAMKERFETACKIPKKNRAL